MRLRIVLIPLLLCLQGLPHVAAASPFDGIARVLAGREQGIQHRMSIVESGIRAAERSLQEAEAVLRQAIAQKDRAAEATAREAVALSRENLAMYREFRVATEADLLRARKSLAMARRLQQLGGTQSVGAAVIERRGRIERGTVEGAWQAVADDSAAPLRSGDRLRSGRDGAAEFMLQDGATAAQIGADTELRLTFDDLGNTVVDLTRGAFYAAVNPLLIRMRRFEVRTPTAAVAVRGTRFAVREEGAVTELLVLEGRVEVTAQEAAQPIVVEAGQRLVLHAGGATEAQPIDWDATRRWWHEETEL